MNLYECVEVNVYELIEANLYVQKFTFIFKFAFVRT